MTVARDFMTADLVVLSPDEGVHAAMRRLLAADVSGAPVVDERGELVGILTERDLLAAIARASYHKDLGGTVATYMSRDVRTVDAETELLRVVELFLESRFRRFPVLSGTRLVGLISRRDILRAVEALW